MNISYLSNRSIHCLRFCGTWFSLFSLLGFLKRVLYFVCWMPVSLLQMRFAFIRAPPLFLFYVCLRIPKDNGTRWLASDDERSADELEHRAPANNNHRVSVTSGPMFGLEKWNVWFCKFGFCMFCCSASSSLISVSLAGIWSIYLEHEDFEVWSAVPVTSEGNWVLIYHTDLPYGYAVPVPCTVLPYSAAVVYRICWPHRVCPTLSLNSVAYYKSCSQGTSNGTKFCPAQLHSAPTPLSLTTGFVISPRHLKSRGGPAGFHRLYPKLERISVTCPS